jgi:hypothetical protein
MARRGLAAALGMALALVVLVAAEAPAGPILAACRKDAFKRPAASNARPPRPLLNRLAVLRHGHRPQLATGEYFTLHRIAVRYVRRLRTGYYLLPATVRPSDVTTPVLCRQQRGSREEARRERRALHSYGLYLVSIAPDGSFNTPSGLGGRKRELLNNDITNSYADERHTHLAGLVPDGIAAVRVTFGQRTHEDRVTRNLWVIRLPGSIPPDRFGGITTEWLDEHGTVRRSFRGF